LKSKGVRRVRPLQGGFEAWRAMGFPLVVMADTVNADSAVGKIEALGQQTNGG
jgi:3-mercaptopyruvate sulfurtransferase SseA